jgi:hypothetical protein
VRWSVLASTRVGASLPYTACRASCCVGVISVIRTLPPLFCGSRWAVGASDVLLCAANAGAAAASVRRYTVADTPLHYVCCYLCVLNCTCCSSYVLCRFMNVTGGLTVSSYCRSTFSWFSITLRSLRCSAFSFCAVSFCLALPCSFRAVLLRYRFCCSVPLYCCLCVTFWVRLGRFL